MSPVIRHSDAQTTTKIKTALEAENISGHIAGFRDKARAHLREAMTSKPVVGETVEFYLNGSDDYLGSGVTNGQGIASCESGGHITRLQESIQAWQEGYTAKYLGGEKYEPAPDSIGNVNLIPGL
ncbi:hypothetical protein [Streptomyces rubellomurinus]|uniref:Uncharacterized protein n=2 Tax=Streptomyces TaxID=1883 RepID=A0A0F2THZ6_STRR3|nr:hypothetical protein [Streptomyces rubellomurinus]KJS61900.1 hypothetical protein VM95_12085 [Streptomyces rubellomurinus]